MHVLIPFLRSQWQLVQLRPGLAPGWMMFVEAVTVGCWIMTQVARTTEVQSEQANSRCSSSCGPFGGFRVCTDNRLIYADGRWCVTRKRPIYSGIRYVEKDTFVHMVLGAEKLTFGARRTPWQSVLRRHLEAEGEVPKRTQLKRTEGQLPIAMARPWRPV